MDNLEPTTDKVEIRKKKKKVPGCETSHINSLHSLIILMARTTTPSISFNIIEFEHHHLTSASSFSERVLPFHPMPIEAVYDDNDEAPAHDC